jgi:hypothetical protein
LSASSAARALLGRHGNAVIDPRRSRHQQAGFAIARNNHFSFAATLQDRIKSIQFQIMLGFVLSMALYAGSLEKWQNVLFKSYILFVRGGGQFGDIDFADVPFFCRRILGGGLKTGHQ